MSRNITDVGWRIVASQTMHTGPVPGVRGMNRTRRGSAGPGGTWVFVAWPNTCVLVQSRHASELGVWRRLRMMQRPVVAYQRVPGLNAVSQFGHYHNSPDTAAIVQAVYKLRDEWLMNLPVDWRVVDCKPTDSLPCLWPVFSLLLPPELNLNEEFW